MRDAIMGDLHQEFVHDVRHLGMSSARARLRDRALGIVAHAVWDAVCWRSWVSSNPRAVPEVADRSPKPPAQGVVQETYVRARGVAGYLGLTLIALGVLALGIVINTTVFMAVESGAPRTEIALGLAGLVLLIACAALAAIMICVVPRLRAKRAAGTLGS